MRPTLQLIVRAFSTCSLHGSGKVSGKKKKLFAGNWSITLCQILFEGHLRSDIIRDALYPGEVAGRYWVLITCVGR